MQANLLKATGFHTTFSALLSDFPLLVLGKGSTLFVRSGGSFFQAVRQQELEDSRQHCWFHLHHHICHLWPFGGAQQGNHSSMYIHLHNCLHAPFPLCRRFFTFNFCRGVGQLGISQILQLLHLRATSKRSIPGSFATDQAIDGEVGRRQLEESVSFLILQGHKSKHGKITNHAFKPGGGYLGNNPCPPPAEQLEYSTASPCQSGCYRRFQCPLDNLLPSWGI